ncbi:MAG: MFS transporter [Moraxellaceae bacterium]|nr:MFS transporter [Pseudobdellovibrionaceae bacterium]
MSEENENKALNPTVIKLGLVSFFADVASEMLYPITPIFLTTVLGASMSSLGLIEGVAESLASLLKTYSGSWSDSISRRKPFIAVGYFLGAISKPFIGLSTSWVHVLGARSLDRTGKGIRSAPRDALIADSVDPSQRGEAFGWHRGMDTFGAAVGPLFAILLLSLNPSNLRSLYYWALIPGLLSVFIILFIREPKPHPLTVKKWQNPLKSWNFMTINFKKYMCAWGFFSLTNFSDVFLLMKAKSSGCSTTTVILLFCVYNLIYSLSSPYLGKLSDRVDRQKVLMLGLGIFAVVYLGFGFANQQWHYWILFSVYGLYMGATEGVSKALAIDYAPINLKATSIGILGTVTGLGTLVASVFAGLIWDRYGATSTFVFGASGAFLALILIKKSSLTFK